MSSVVRVCVRRSLAYVCLSYVQPSRGKTFAYLRSFALLYERTSSPAETNRARGKEKSKERTIHTHTHIHTHTCSPSSSPRRVELRLLRSVILRLCSRNETFLKNARFILAPLVSPGIHRVLTGCPANRIYRTAWLYRTPPLNVPLN